MQQIEAEDWVNWTLGCDEAEFRLHRRRSAALLDCGSVQRFALHAAAPPRISPAPPLIGLYPANDELDLSVSRLQAWFPGATFQVASNWNALEGSSSVDRPRHNEFLTRYAYDETQGPDAVMGAPTAAVARLFWDPYDQTRQELNLLGSWCQRMGPDRAVVRHGYLQLKQRGLALPWSEVQGLVHKNVPVLLRQAEEYGKLDILPRNPQRRIHQVFTAALNRAQGRDGRINHENDASGTVSQALLRAAFASVYQSLAWTGSDTVFLTPVGAGVFGNRLEDVYSAMLWAHATWAPPMLRQAFVVLHDHETPKPAAAPAVRFSTRTGQWQDG